MNKFAKLAMGLLLSVAMIAGCGSSSIQKDNGEETAEEKNLRVEFYSNPVRG